MTDRVLLIGMMGAGKSTAGSLLARRLGWRYLDSDEEVRRETGRSVAEIFEESGEAAFRAQESRVLAQAVTSDVPVVVSVAGGAVLDPENSRRLRKAGTVVWLRAGLKTLAARVEAGTGRPLLGDDPRGALAQLYERRRPFYRELADLVIDVDHLAPVQVVDTIRSRLPHLSGRAGAAR